MTYTLIAHTELGSAQADITFSSIAATFTDLLLVVSGRTSRTGSADILDIQFNANGYNSSGRYLYGNAASGNGSFSYSNGLVGQVCSSVHTANTFSSTQIYIPNYRSAAAKSWGAETVIENNASEAELSLNAGLWNNTAAITSITIKGRNNSFVQYTSATLYGITAGSSGGVVVS